MKINRGLAYKMDEYAFKQQHISLKIVKSDKSFKKTNKNGDRVRSHYDELRTAKYFDNQPFSLLHQQSLFLLQLFQYLFQRSSIVSPLSRFEISTPLLVLLILLSSHQPNDKKKQKKRIKTTQKKVMCLKN